MRGTLKEVTPSGCRSASPLDAPVHAVDPLLILLGDFLSFIFASLKRNHWDHYSSIAVTRTRPSSKIQDQRDTTFFHTFTCDFFGSRGGSGRSCKDQKECKGSSHGSTCISTATVPLIDIPDLFKCWLSGWVKDLGEPVVEELQVDWLDPFLTVEEQGRLLGWHLGVSLNSDARECDLSPILPFSG